MSDTPPLPTATVQFTVKPTRKVEIVAKFSMGRFFRILFAWLGIPAGIAAGFVFGPGSEGALAMQAWLVAGLATMFLNFSGIVPIRARERIESEA